MKKSRTTKQRRAIAFILASAVIGMSCSSDSDGSPTTSAPPAQYGGSINVGIFDTLPGFCVGNNPANSALMATRSIYETLFEKSENGQMVGLLAKDASSSSDLKTWTITLREGITFHDGTRFDAAAVVANFNAITGRVALGAFAADGPQGLAATAYTIGTGTAFTANINSFEAISDYVVEFNLDRPQYDFRSTLYASGRFFMRSPRQLLNAKTCGQSPIGTGPFRISSWNPNEMTVTRNASYWRKDPISNKQLPYLDAITFQNVKEASQRAGAVRSATLDAGFFSAATDSATIVDLRSRSTVKETKSPDEYYPSLWLNQGKPGSPFRFLSARQAVLSCIDRSNFVKVRTKNETSVAESIVGPTSLMFSTENFPEFNSDKAQEYVNTYKEESGETSLQFTFPADSSTTSQLNAQFLKSTWLRCNIKAEYVIEEGAVIIAKAFNASPQLDKGGYYNAYDAIPITLLEGTDAAFNIPFLVTNAYTKSSMNPVKQLLGASLGPVLGLNHHDDTKIDDFLYAGQAQPSASEAATYYQEATSYIQKNAVMGAINRFYYSLFTTNKIAGIGSLQLPNEQRQRVISNWGIDWTGVYKLD
jgi:peptide/nickel transport system substrate-binding protein